MVSDGWSVPSQLVWLGGQRCLWYAVTAHSIYSDSHHWHWWLTSSLLIFIGLVRGLSIPLTYFGESALIFTDTLACVPTFTATDSAASLSAPSCTGLTWLFFLQCPEAGTEITESAAYLQVGDQCYAITSQRCLTCTPRILTVMFSFSCSCRSSLKLTTYPIN